MKKFLKNIDYAPWQREESDLEDQLAWQRELAEYEQIEIGDGCFISRKAAFFPDSFTCGKDCFICAEAMVRGHIEFGSDCSVNSYTVIAGTVKIGNQVRIASNASIFGFNHGHERTDIPIFHQAHTSKGIVIEDDVWVGAGVVIVDGVRVGAHSILAGGAIITKDVPPYSIMGGNPAKRLRDRRHPKISSPSLEKQLRTFGARTREEHASIIKRCIDPQTRDLKDHAKEPTSVRAWCDAVEISGFFDEQPPEFSREELVQKLSSFQNPETGCFDQDLTKETKTPIEQIQANGYSYLCVGYALEVLGSHLLYKNNVLEQIPAEELTYHLNHLPWQTNAWGAGVWIDNFATAAYHELKHHQNNYDLSTLLGWLHLNCDPSTGLWGAPSRSERWLQPINGFYRLTRGTFAQFKVSLPKPIDAIDTILMHSRQRDHFLTHDRNACNVLDIVHPLWLCAKQTDYRKPEIETLMRKQIDKIISQWISHQGFAFDESTQPGLQGTEMWLSILYLAADYLGYAKSLGYSPKGVHRTKTII